MTQNLQELMVRHLTECHGWTPDRLLSTVTTKDFDTAAGTRQATIRCTFDPLYKQYWLNGEYLSEGRNALSSCIVCVPLAADPQAALVAVDVFVADVDKAIGETYAVRLLRQRSLEVTQPWT